MAYKWGSPPQSRTVAFYHRRVGELVQEKLKASGLTWEEAVFRNDLELTREDLQALEDELLATGVRFEMSADISKHESPDKYQTAEAGEFPLAAADEQGRIVVGGGDNVFTAGDVTGIARFISDVDRVMDMLTDGVPPDTVAIIDDSGGTLTAPILEEFTAVVCKGGSVRSHLGILTREYQIPCLMNAQVAGLEEGDRVQVEYSVPAKISYTAEEEGQGHARVWKLT
jgi:hypothetical protein